MIIIIIIKHHILSSETVEIPVERPTAEGSQRGRRASLAWFVVLVQTRIMAYVFIMLSYHVILGWLYCTLGGGASRSPVTYYDMQCYDADNI